MYIKSNLKKKFRIGLIVVASFVGLLLSIYILLWLPPVQQKIKDVALAEIMKKTHNRIRIGKLSFHPFNRLQLDDVFVEDLKGDTLLFVKNVSASFNLFRLLDKQLLIHSVGLEHFIIRINKDNSDAKFNFQFLIDAFQSEKQDTTSSGMIIQISDIALKNGRLYYDILSSPTPKEGVFDANHIYISNFTAEIALNSIDLKKLDTAVKRFSFIERSGLNVFRLEAKLTSRGKNINLKNFRLTLPHSELTIPEAKLDYTGYTFTECLKKGTYSLLSDNNHLSPEDVKMFYPPLAELTGELTFTGSAGGTFPRIDVSSLAMNYGSCIASNFRASMNDYTNWQNTPFQLDLEHFSADSQGIEELLAFFSRKKEIHSPGNTGVIDLKAHLKGSLPNMQLNLKAVTGSGSLQLTGSGGYHYNSETTHFDAQLEATDFDLQTLLQDTLYGRADLQIKAQGTIGDASNTKALGTAIISRFDFNRYSYHDIQAGIVYSGDSLHLKIDSEDANAPLNIRGDACFCKSSPEIRLYARLDSVYLDSLHLFPDYNVAYLSTLIRAEMKGMNIEDMNLSLAIDSFLLHTEKGSFKEQQLRLNYLATDDNRKQLDISSHLFNVSATGNFTYAGVKKSLAEAFPVLFSNNQLPVKKENSFPGNFRFRATINHTHLLSDILELPETIPDSALFTGNFNHDGHVLKLSASAYTQFTESDTLQLSLMLSNKDNDLDLIFNVDNKSNNYNLDGTIDAEIKFSPQQGSLVPGMNITLHPAIWVLNETHFDLHPSQIEVRENRYTIHDLLLDHQSTESIRIKGIISALPDDSLSVYISRFQLGTIFNAVKTAIPLSGEANGEIVAKQLLSKPLILSRGFAVNQLIFAENAIGNLNVRSAWSSERKGLFLRARLDHENHLASTVSGYYLPEKDSLFLTAVIRDLELKWLSGFAQGSLYGLDGSFNADITASGTIQNPQIKGIAYFDKAQVGITQLNTLYSLNDTIHISPDLIELKRFTIKDPDNRTFRLNGKITHRQFADLNPNLSVSLSNFLVINNERQIDSLLYGKLRINGLLNIKKKNNDWVLSGDVTHSDDSRVMVNIPSPAATAERYNSITFINTEKTLATKPGKNKAKQVSSHLAIPLKINVSLWIDPSLTVGAVFNPATKDAAQVKGSGSMNFSYDMSNSTIQLTGNYEIESGKATLSLANLTKKTFTVRQGGKLTFQGDPLATTSDLTALYPLRADLAALDLSFENMNMASTKIPVTCALTAVGNINKMELKYDLLFPDKQEEIQRKVEGLLYTDELKIKEIAYLLAFGTFMPINTQSSNNSVWTSLASSSITSQLNNLLSNVLNENWSIGTDLHTKDPGFSNVNMDVNISTRLFNDRLTVNSTLVYHNDPNQANNFTGDFNLEYKLNPSGNVLLKVYNVTNNQYYRKAKSTQGAGIVYKREARTFGRLFDKFRKKKKQENENN
ncbi:MAG: translocation/assembly module TamB domain-containing protein [Dysgonamonadaceae bacterium]|jgi:hypothetical protein|nr:translocation/assembly module TamB domain-containing protein [Dysgonamonadaceae bacterium]